MLCSNIFANVSPKAKDIKERINKWDYIKLKSFCMAKENISKMKKEPNIWESIFVNDTLDKGLISNYIKNSSNSIPGRQMFQFKKKGTQLQGGHTKRP